MYVVGRVLEQHREELKVLERDVSKLEAVQAPFPRMSYDDAIKNLQALDYACVIVTNQSVIGRGLLSEKGLVEVHDEMHRQLAEHGVRLDGVFFCPAAPSTTDRTLVEHHDRKPGPGMLQKAAREAGGRFRDLSDLAATA